MCGVVSVWCGVWCCGVGVVVLVWCGVPVLVSLCVSLAGRVCGDECQVWSIVGLG